jgi:hypothetical protein
MTADLNTKATRRRLRELAGIAYTRELGAELAKLEADFSKWRSGEIDPFELSDRIHQFHDGIARDLYVRYRNLAPQQTVARALVSHVLDRAEIPSDLLRALEPAIQFFETFSEKTGIEDEEV